ncbi:hypothetical protein AB0O42_11140 [Streptomyces sp. NPDC089922]|uniref:hypothetical protein n=1 Tax=Streptomyces sp. NPDC089922 TaxID=3155189 RepID=UPI00342078B3
MNDPRPAPRPVGPLYDDFGAGRHHESSLARHALGSRHEEALVAGLAGGIGFMYFVFEYAGRPPLPTIAAQAHPDPWVPAVLDRLRVPYEVGQSSRPRWDRVHAGPRRRPAARLPGGGVDRPRGHPAALRGLPGPGRAAGSGGAVP